ncbi:MAG TPA: type II secretion system F family protein [Verrucomicrobiae bacterium]
MSRFAYVALDAKGRENKGQLDAANSLEAVSRLKEMGWFPTKVTEAKSDGKKTMASSGKPTNRFARLSALSFGSKKVKPKQLATLTRQLATMLDAGMPLLRAFRLLQEQEEDKSTLRMLHEIAADIESGNTFSEALARHPKTFDKLYVNMVKAGELGGVLELVLNRLADFLEKAERIKGRVIAAMFYPVSVLLVAFGIVAGLMHFVIPKFQTVFTDLMEGKPFPAFTQMVFDMSARFQKHFLTILVSAIGFWIALSLLRKLPVVGRWWDRRRWNLPVLGNLLRKLALVRFTRTLGTLIASGVPILQALAIVREVAGNQVLADAIDSVHQSVREGESLTTPLRTARIFPPIVVGLMDVGEQTGALPEMLLRIADNAEQDADNIIAALSSLLEPILIVILAVIVGTIVIALFLPITSLIDGDFGKRSTE